MSTTAQFVGFGSYNATRIIESGGLGSGMKEKTKQMDKPLRDLIEIVHFMKNISPKTLVSRIGKDLRFRKDVIDESLTNMERQNRRGI